jgi:hypothetical protein
MREILTRKRDIAAAVGEFRRAVAAVASLRRKAEWVFPNGERAVLETYSITTRGGRLLVGLPVRGARRVMHLFHLDRDEGVLTPDVELNVPATLDRKSSGVYLRDGKNWMLATRGGFSAYRGKIARELVFRHFDKWLIEARDGDGVAQVIPVAALTSPALGDDLIEFVQAVVRLKAVHKQGGDVRYAWRDDDVRSIPSDPIALDHLHGPLCSALEARLAAMTHMNDRYAVCRNRELDVALVETRANRARAIFEIETSISPSVLQAAVGKLLYGRHAYGDANTLLFLVLPSAYHMQVFDLKGYLLESTIGILIRDGADFRAIDGAPLARMLNALLNA